MISYGRIEERNAGLLVGSSLRSPRESWLGSGVHRLLTGEPPYLLDYLKGTWGLSEGWWFVLIIRMG